MLNQHHHDGLQTAPVKACCKHAHKRKEVAKKVTPMGIHTTEQCTDCGCLHHLIEVGDVHIAQTPAP